MRLQRHRVQTVIDSLEKHQAERDVLDPLYAASRHLACAVSHLHDLAAETTP